jgi:hypothetical protein
MIYTFEVYKVYINGVTGQTYKCNLIINFRNL